MCSADLNGRLFDVLGAWIGEYIERQFFPQEFGVCLIPSKAYFANEMGDGTSLCDENLTSTIVNTVSSKAQPNL